VTNRVIEVIGSAMIVRPIELYRATIKIIVRTRKTSNGHTRLLELRQRVIESLRASRIEDSGIVDAGVTVSRSIWSSKQSMVQAICIQSPDCEIFARAISGIERVFQDAKPAFFSGIENDFSFEEDEPVYASKEEANELALRAAVQNAAGKARILAEEAKLNLLSVVAMTEIQRPPRKRLTEYGSKVEDPIDFDSHLSVRGYDLDYAQEVAPYTRVAPRETTGLIMLRVVFAVEETA
jgi:hypothetical protein